MNRALRSILALTLLVLAPVTHAASCQISTTDLVFGNYRFNADNDVETSATVSIDNCVDDGSGTSVGYTISIGAGTSADAADRSMNGPGSPLHYNLYADANRTMVWGDGNGGTVTVSGGFTLPGTTSASHTAYGRIPSHQAVAPGTYADLLTISIEY